MPSSRISVPQTPNPSLVFVHGGWTARVGMRLAAQGMRLDSLETAIRQNPTCSVASYADSYTTRLGAQHSSLKATLDFTPRAHGFPEQVEISPGNSIRVAEGVPLTDECQREIEADRNGVIDVSPFVWQGDLPGLPSRGALYVRDMGPTLNADLIRLLPERIPMIFYTPAQDVEPVLVPYDEGMSVIWTNFPPGAAGRL